MRTLRSVGAAGEEPLPVLGVLAEVQQRLRRAVGGAATLAPLQGQLHEVRVEWRWEGMMKMCVCSGGSTGRGAATGR
eukprot:1159557-Pelagomonas_calceolata.AAC.19